MSIRRRIGRSARLSLLLAALLYGAGPAVEPLLHLDDGAWAAAAESGDGPTSPPTVPHDDVCCFLCLGLGGAAQLAFAGSLPEPLTAADPAPHDRASRPASVRPARYRARGPPVG